MDSSAVDIPEVVAELRAVFERYEAALVANEVDVLDELFWPDHRTQRIGLADRQQGFAEVQYARRAVPRQTPPRTLKGPVITTFGRDVGVVTTEFVTEDPDLPLGRQSQTWIRFAAGWRVVAAHVSTPGL